MEYGKNWRIYISDGATPGVFSPIGGEGSWSKRSSSDSIDLSSKDDGNYKAQGWGQQTVTFSVQGKVKLPDVGLEQAYDVSKAATPEIVVQLRKGATIKWQGKVGVGNFSLEGPNNGPVTYSFDLSAVEAPTVDDLAA